MKYVNISDIINVFDKFNYKMYRWRSMGIIFMSMEQKKYIINLYLY
jgi:hypothetical protein